MLFMPLRVSIDKPTCEKNMTEAFYIISLLAIIIVLVYYFDKRIRGAAEEKELR